MSRSKTRFLACAAVAHTKLLGIFPGIKLGQTQQLLASALGHKTYQSFALSGDAEAFDRAEMAVLDPAAVMLRAMYFKLPLGKDEWSVLIEEISAKQVVGTMELREDLGYAYWLARHAFQQADDPRIAALVRPYKCSHSYGRLLSEQIDITATELKSDEGPLPAILRAAVHGEICAEGEDYVGLAMPVMADYALERIGRNLYDGPVLLNIRQLGEPRRFCPAEEFDGGMPF